MKTIRAIAIALLLPVMLYILYREAGLRLSKTGHEVAELLILLVACGLALGLYWFEEIDQLRDIHSGDTPHYYRINEDHEGMWSYRQTDTGGVPTTGEETSQTEAMENSEVRR